MTNSTLSKHSTFVKVRGGPNFIITRSKFSNMTIDQESGLIEAKRLLDSNSVISFKKSVLDRYEIYLEAMNSEELTTVLSESLPILSPDDEEDHF